MNPDFTQKNNTLDLNSFDVERFENDEEYQDKVRESPVGVAVEVLATSLTLQDCGEFLALTHPEILRSFFDWAAKDYPELEINPETATQLVRETVEKGEHQITEPDR